MPYKATSGIYMIQSLCKPERVYIGSAININDRWGRHRRAFSKNKHENIKLQRHYSKYGVDDLVFDVLESGDYLCKNHLLSREQGWFNRFKYQNTEIPYFNIEGIAGSPLGVKRSDETKVKIKEAWKTRLPTSKETREKMSKTRTGKHKRGVPWSKETRDKIMASRKPMTKEQREKRALVWKGKKHTEETKQKTREWNLNRPPFTEEHCKNIREGLKKSKKNNKRSRNNLGQYE